MTDLIACGFLDTARHKFGINVPRYLCVIGFDDIEQAPRRPQEAGFDASLGSVLTSTISGLALSTAPSQPPPSDLLRAM